MPRRFLAAHWVGLLVTAVVAPVIIGQKWPEFLGWSLTLGTVLAAGVVGSVWAWRRGADAGTLTPLVAAMAIVVVLGYAGIAPRLNDRNSHRALAAKLDQLLPPEEHTVMFFRELDEGLWYYLRDRDLKPVPGSQPRYNTGYDLLADAMAGRLIWDEKARMKAASQVLVDWLKKPEHETPYVLIRAEDYDFFADEFAKLVTPLYREPNLQRNELMLLRVNPAAGASASTVASGPSDSPPSPTRR